MNVILKVILFSAIAYAYLFIIAKILGKKQIAQLSFIDYVVGITIGSIAAEMATDIDQPFYHYLIAMAVFLVFDLLITYFGRKSAGLKQLLTGKPLILIFDGQIDYHVLKKSKMTINELAGMARDKGYFDLNDIAYAILETSGKLSVLPKSEMTPIVAKDMNLHLPKAQLTTFVIVDGHLKQDALLQINRDTAWALNNLQVKSEDELSNIIVGIYDSKHDNIVAQYKNEQPRKFS